MVAIEKKDCYYVHLREDATTVTKASIFNTAILESEGGTYIIGTRRFKIPDLAELFRISCVHCSRKMAQASRAIFCDKYSALALVQTQIIPATSLLRATIVEPTEECPYRHILFDVPVNDVKGIESVILKVYDLSEDEVRKYAEKSGACCFDFCSTKYLDLVAVEIPQSPTP